MTTVTETLVVGNLRHGACTIEALARLCGVSRRDIEEAVEQLRLDGEPIVAGPYGLRLTDDPEELSAYVKGRRDRARSILRASRPLRATVDRLRQRDLVLWNERGS